MKGDQFRTVVLVNGGGTASRPARNAEVAGLLTDNGLPEYEIYERGVQIEGTGTKVLDPKFVYFLPEPTDPNDEDGGVLGATYWGRTISSGFDSWGIEPDEQPGIVCGVFREEKVGSSIEVEGDSIGEPVAGNPNASMAVQVLQ